VVEIYRNLNRRDGVWFSIRSRKTGRVIQRVNLTGGDELLLKDVTFRVSEAGRTRVRREKRKNVHALMVGTKVTLNHLTPFGNDGMYRKYRVSYNPYRDDNFVGTRYLENGQSEKIVLYEAAFVTMDDGGVIAWIYKEKK